MKFSLLTIMALFSISSLAAPTFIKTRATLVAQCNSTPKEHEKTAGDTLDKILIYKQDLNTFFVMEKARQEDTVAQVTVKPLMVGNVPSVQYSFDSGVVLVILTTAAAPAGGTPARYTIFFSSVGRSFSSTYTCTK